MPLNKILLPLVLFSTAFLAAPAHASLIYGSGQGVNPTGGYTIDPHWQIVALPVSYTNYAVPYSAYNPAPSSLFWAYFGVNGYANNGTTNYWLAPNTTGGSLPAPAYNWIAAQTFTITTAGFYNFNFQGTADNQMSFYVNGSITNTATEFPTITGGTQIGNSWDNFQQLGTFTGTAYLEAGTNTAYMVLYDYGGLTAALITQSSFQSAAVPEPGTWAAAALLVGTAGFMRWRKRQTAC